MPGGKKLGIYWGQKFLNLIETSQDTPVKLASLPIVFSDSMPQAPMGSASTLEVGKDLTLINGLRDLIKAQKFTVTQAYLALPSKDIIIRSFVIPWMKTNEVRGVVDFEIKKYIPLNVKDLSFQYYPVTFMDNKVRKIRILFVAIRKEILDRHVEILKQAGLNVVFSEPASVSFSRALIQKKHIRTDQKIAVVQADAQEARIIIVDQGITQFVRDFQIQGPMPEGAVLDPQMLMKKLFTEIKISLDFYARQYTNEKIDNIILLSSAGSQELLQGLEQELDTKVKSVDPRTVVDKADAMDMGWINAFGVVLGDAVLSPANFNLSAQKVDTDSMQHRLRSLLTEYMTTIKIAALCLAILFAGSTLGNLMLSQDKKKVETLTQQLGAFLDLSAQEIQDKIQVTTDKLNGYKAVRVKGKVAYLSKLLPTLLPPGVWLKELSIKYDEFADPAKVATAGPNAPKIVKLSLDFSGYAYVPDTNEQIMTVNKFIMDLDANEKFKKMFDTINVLSLQTQELKGHEVTLFTVSCR